MNLKLPHEITIVQDTSEKRPWFSSKEFEDVHVFKHKLEYGDYGHNAVEVERKSVNDIARCLLTQEVTRGGNVVHRWRDFLSKTKNASFFLRDRYCIIVEGSYRDVIESQSGPMNRRIKRARLHQIQKYAKVIFAGDRETAQVIALEKLCRSVYDDDKPKHE